MANNYIDVSGLKRSFAKKDVLQDISFSLKPGEILGLVGLNGAGKTTLIRILLGLINRDNGSVKLFNKDPQKADGLLFSDIGVILENSGFYGNLTVSENLNFYAASRKLTTSVRDEFIEKFVARMDIYKKDSKVKHFSRGEKMQCAIARAFMGFPKLLIFDEPTMGLDMNAYKLFRELVFTAQKKGSAVLISSHNLDAIEELCSDITILENGKLTRLDTTDKKLNWSIKFIDIPINIMELLSDFSLTDITINEQVLNFSIDEEYDEELIISKIIEMLAGAGYRICQVKKDILNIKDSLQKYYGN